MPEDKLNRGSIEIEDLVEEECRLNLVKAIVDAGCAIIISGVLERKKLPRLQRYIKSSVMQFIPAQETKYDMIYGSRLKRYMEQFPNDKL